MANTVITVLAPDCRINLGMLHWFDALGVKPNIKIQRHDCTSARNAAVYDFMKGPGTHLLLIDSGVWPDRDCLAILDCPYNVAYMGHTATGGHIAHMGDGNLGLAFARLSRKALESIEPPWFEYERDAVGARIVRCECMVLCERLKEAGFQTHMIGTVWHNAELLERPGIDGGAEITTKNKFMWDQFENSTTQLST